MNRIIAALAVTAGLVLTLTACMDDDATVVSDNISKAADNFEVNRRIVMFNGITDDALAAADIATQGGEQG